VKDRKKDGLWSQVEHVGAVWRLSSPGEDSAAPIARDCRPESP